MEKKYRKFIESENRKNRKKFLKIPFSERLILLPQCLRNSKNCIAKEEGPIYRCALCGKCAVAKITVKAGELGYKAVYVLKGGKIIPDIFKKQAPGAVIGVACYYEGFLGMNICREFKIPVQFFSLLRDGCADTEVDIDAFLKFMED